MLDTWGRLGAAAGTVGEPFCRRYSCAQKEQLGLLRVRCLPVLC